MKKVNKIFAALLLPALATSAYAVKFEVMPTVAKAVADSDKDSLKDTEILYGIRGSVYLNEEVAIQAGFEASADNVMSDNGKTDIERGSLNMIYEPNNGKRVRLYGLAGFGGEKVHRVSNPRTNDDSQIFANLGAGLKFGISDRVDLVTEAKWLRKLENKDNDIIATVGLGVKLGESKKSVDPIPSVTQTSEVENAISLAKLREINERKSKQSAAKVEPTVVSTTEPIAVQDEMVEAVFVEDITEDITEATAASQDGFYVQMAALFKGSGEELTSRLEQKDYPYVLHNVQRSGKEALLVLVGPYESRVEAGVAIKYLKRLKRDAFIYHMN